MFTLGGEGRHELERIVASDYSRAQISVKLESMSSDVVLEQVERSDALAKATFAGTGITALTTGSGRLFSTLDHYLVTSQLSSFATAFFTVFGVIFVVFRSARFGFLTIVPNVLTHNTVIVASLLLLGVAKVAGAIGLIYKQNWGVDRVFEPNLDAARREEGYRGWKKAVERAKGWLRE